MGACGVDGGPNSHCHRAIPADNSYAMKKKLDAIISRGRLRRCFDGWWGLVEQARFDAVVVAHQNEQRRVDRYTRRLRERAVMVYQRRKLAPFFYAWKRETEVGRGRGWRALGRCKEAWSCRWCSGCNAWTSVP